MLVGESYATKLKQEGDFSSEASNHKAIKASSPVKSHQIFPTPLQCKDNCFRRVLLISKTYDAQLYLYQYSL